MFAQEVHFVLLVFFRGYDVNSTALVNSAMRGRVSVGGQRRAPPGGRKVAVESCLLKGGVGNL